MIIEIQIPDEIYEQYGKSGERLQQRLLETAGMKIDPALRKYQLSSENLAVLRQHFGPNIKDGDALVDLILKVGTIRLQQAHFKLNSDQSENLITQAYFQADTGEPRDRNEAGFTREQHKLVIQRYTDEVLNEAVNYVLGLL